MLFLGGKRDGKLPGRGPFERIGFLRGLHGAVFGSRPGLLVVLFVEPVFRQRVAFVRGSAETVGLSAAGSGNVLAQAASEVPGGTAAGLEPGSPGILPVDFREVASLRHRGGDNCCIVLAGSFTEAHLEAVNRLFGGDDWRGRKAGLEAGKGMVVTLPEEHRREVPFPGALQAAIMTGMPLFPFQSPDFAPFRVVDYVLGGYFGSRLMRNIREDKGYTYGISSYVVPMRFMPVWAISSEVKADCAGKVLDEIEKEIEDLQRKEIGPDELELVRSAFMGDFLQELDGTFDVAERMKLFLLMGVGPEFYRSQEEVLFSITPAEIREYARKFLDPGKLRTVVAGAEGLL